MGRGGVAINASPGVIHSAPGDTETRYGLDASVVTAI